MVSPESNQCQCVDLDRWEIHTPPVIIIRKPSWTILPVFQEGRPAISRLWIEMLLMIFLMILLLSMHLVCMHFASTVPLFCIWLARREAKKGDALAGQAGRWMAGAALLLFHVGLVLGLVLAWVMHIDGEKNFLAATRDMPERIKFGYWEMGFYVVIMGAYFLWWKLWSLNRPWQRGVHALLAVLAATDLLYHFPPLFAILSRQANPALAVEGTIDNAKFVKLMFTEPVIYPTLHFWLASIIVSAVFILRWMGSRLCQDSTGHAKSIVKTSARVALIATVLQLIVGIGVLLHLPDATKSNLMGQSISATLMFAVGAFAAFALMHVLGTLAMGEATIKMTRRALMFVLLVILCMSGAHILGRGDDYRSEVPAQSHRKLLETPLLITLQLG